MKDKLFFFLSSRISLYPGVRAAYHGHRGDSGIPGCRYHGLPNSTAALLYNNFAPTVTAAGDPGTDLTNYITSSDAFPASQRSFATLLCPDKTNALIASRMAAIVGVTAADQAAMAVNGCSSIPGLQTGTFPRTGVPVLQNTVAINGSQSQIATSSGNLFNGWEASGRFDYNFTPKDRFFVQLSLNRLTDEFGQPNTTSNSNGRGPGFLNPILSKSPNGQISYIHTFSPTVLNEFRAGYALTLPIPVTSPPHCRAFPTSGSTMGAWDSARTRGIRRRSTRTFTATRTWSLFLMASTT